MNERTLSSTETEILDRLLELTRKSQCDPKLLQPGFDLLPLGVLREFLGWNQRQCADYVGVERPTWTEWENGKKRPDNTKLYKFLSHVLNVHYARLPHIATFPKQVTSTR